MPALNVGIIPPGQGDRDTVWNILGQTYYLKEVCDTSFAFEVVGEPGTFVPAHIHPTQDEFIYLIEGEMELTLDGRPHGLTTVDLRECPWAFRTATRTSAIKRCTPCSGLPRRASCMNCSPGFIISRIRSKWSRSRPPAR